MRFNRYNLEGCHSVYRVTKKNNTLTALFDCDLPHRFFDEDKEDSKNEEPMSLFVFEEEVDRFKELREYLYAI